MDIELSLEIQEDMPKFNQEVIDGLVYSGMTSAKDEVDRLISCAEKSFPKGFEYLGSSICSPQKAFRVMATQNARSTKKLQNIDISRTDVYLVEYRFRFNGVDLYPRYFFLPYTRKGGLMRIFGKQFAISPVLADPGFSVGEDHVFIRLPRALVTFRQFHYSVLRDGEVQKVMMPYSKLHNKSAGKDKRYESDTIRLGSVHTTLAHYLFCRYGLVEAFHMCGIKDVLVTTEQELKENPVDHEKYCVFTSRKIPPRTLKNKREYELYASPVAVVIPHIQVNRSALNLVCGMFYILDHYPEYTERETLEDPWFWKQMLGYVLWGDHLSVTKLVENVDSHLNTMDDYIDQIAKNTLLEEEGLDIDNIYQLFVYMFENLEDIIETRGEEIGSMYGKRLMTSTYVLKDIYERVFRCLFEIVNNRKRVYGVSEYNKTLGRFFSPTAIFSLRLTSQKPFVSTVSMPGDNLLYKLTSRLVMQSNATGGKSGDLNVNDPSVWLHASILEAGNHTLLPKNRPLAKSTLNPTVKLDHRKVIVRKEHLRETIDYVQDVIRRH